jgi:hypothetical protein
VHVDTCLNGCSFDSCIAGMQWELGQVHRVAMFVLNLCRILIGTCYAG